MTPTLTRIGLLLVIAAGYAAADSFSAEQCPNFAKEEQPYFYLYTAEGFMGDPLYITNASIPDLGAVQIGLSYSSYFDDKASSLMLRGKWRICTDDSYGGDCKDLSSSSWKSELATSSIQEEYGEEFNNLISSIQLQGCSQF